MDLTHRWAMQCKLVVAGRVELPAYGLGNHRSIRLSYATKILERLEGIEPPTCEVEAHRSNPTEL